MGVKERREREEQARLTEILRAAEAVFAEQGYHQARMDDIAEKAELAKGTLYYYFKSKDEIFLHILERETGTVVAEIRRRITEDSTLLQALDEMMKIFLEYFDKNQGFLKMFLPCMCRFVKFENEDVVRKSTRVFESHTETMRGALRAKIARENAPFSADALLHFVRTLQNGIGLKLLEGKKAEARAAAQFFLDIMKRIVEEKS
jgi:AcrR family transcriptional regulator